MQLKGKTALVLASSKGLGKAIAEGLAAEGVDLVIGARNVEQLQDTAAQLRQISHSNILAIPVDVSKSAEVQHIIEATSARYGKLDILVNNAGGPPFGSFESFDDQDWQHAFELTLLSVVRSCRLALPYLRKSGSGRIINITSLSVKTYLESSVLSTSLRLGVTGLAKMLSHEFGPFNITVNNIAPGFILTDRIRDTLLHTNPQGLSEADLLAQRAKAIPLGRIGRPEELAALAVFLASPLSSYITGTTIPVDGGVIKALY